jgi:hypothetical protein
VPRVGYIDLHSKGQFDIHRYTSLQNIISFQTEQFPEKKILISTTRLEIWQIGRIKNDKYVIFWYYIEYKEEVVEQTSKGCVHSTVREDLSSGY